MPISYYRKRDVEIRVGGGGNKDCEVGLGLVRGGGIPSISYREGGGVQC